MKPIIRWLIPILMVICLQLPACQQKSGTYHKIKPAHVEHNEETGLNRLKLVAKAVERLDIQTSEIIEMPKAESASLDTPAALLDSGTQRMVIPYAALLYDAQGNTWIYTNPEPGTYVRNRISVDHIKGDLAVLSESPPAGTKVVTVGAAELFGAEFEVGH